MPAIPIQKSAIVLRTVRGPEQSPLFVCAEVKVGNISCRQSFQKGRRIELPHHAQQTRSKRPSPGRLQFQLILVLVVVLVCEFLFVPTARSHPIVHPHTRSYHTTARKHFCPFDAPLPLPRYSVILKTSTRRIPETAVTAGSRPITIAILSDIHFACALEQARGEDYEIAAVPNPFLQFLLKNHRRYFWLRFRFRQNHLLDTFLKEAPAVDHVIANGDYSCDTGFVGVSDDAAFQSAKDCLGILRDRFGAKFHASYGDHELGKYSFVGGNGGLRLASFYRARKELGLEPFWKLELGRYVLISVVSTLVALPVFEPEALPEELPEWRRLREEHLSEIRETFAALKSDQRVILFCHDPTALPFLWREDSVRARLPQLEQTIIGHLHSNFIFWQSRLLAGMPTIRFLGHTARRMSSALGEARHWKAFHVRLCPSLAGIELLKDGGFLTAELDEDAKQPAQFRLHRIAR
jgi:hypothetical protein